jgi:hypothetical protein
VSDAVVTVIIWRCSTVARSAIASAIISCIMIRGIIRAAPATIVQGLAGGGFAAAPVMAATIVVRIMIGWIIHTATLHRAQRARSTITSAVIVRIMICEIICAATAIHGALHATK